MTNLPSVPLSDALVDRIAKEIAALVSDHIETMYPDAAKAVAWKSAKISIQGVVCNAVSSAGKAAETGHAEAWIARSKAQRVKFKRQWREACK
jgi:hypothetical protein